MMGRTHLAIGVLLLFLLQRFSDLIQGNELWAAGLILLASVLPDIDHARSFLGRKVPLIGWIFKHRGLFHSIFGMISFTVIVHLILNERNLTLVFMIGYGAHLVADSVTKEGTKLFYPRDMKIKGPLRVGSFAETLIILCLVALAVYLLI